MFKRRRHHTYAFFVYLVPDGDQLEIRCPHGGITADASGPLEAFDIAYAEACERFARRPWETLVLVEQRTKLRQQQAELMWFDKRRADNEFKLMLMR